MRLDLTVQGVHEASFTLRGMAAAAGDASPALADLADDFRRMTSAQFASEGAYRSGGWPPLAPSTIAERERLGFGGAHPILVRTGMLERSLTVAGDPQSRVEVSRDELLIASRVPYAAFHHSKKPRKRLPRRPLVEFTSEDIRRWAKRIQRHIVEQRHRTY